MPLTQVRYEQSYPFLALAKKHGLDYGDVLMFAEGIDTIRREVMAPLPSQYCMHAQRLTPEARRELLMLTDLPVHERGGRHEEKLPRAATNAFPNSGNPIGEA